MIQKLILLNLITLATSKNKKNIIKILLSEGGDVNCQTSSNGDTEMNIAIRNDNLQIWCSDPK